MLRITSGEYRNRKLDVLETGKIRPMMEKPRQAIFSILMQDVVEEEIVLDCFAGSGVLGFECLSRGASHCVFFDTDRSHLIAIEKFAEKLGCASRVQTVSLDVMKTLSPSAKFHLPEGRPARLIFLDPPHAMSNEAQDPFWTWFGELGGANVVGDETICVVGHHARIDTPEASGRWQRTDRRDYGRVGFSIYEIGSVG